MSRKQNDFVSRWQFWKCANERVFCNNCYNKGIKLGKQIREDEILKIIKRRIKFWTLRKDTINVEPCRNKKVELEELEEEITKQKIKGDEK